MEEERTAWLLFSTPATRYLYVSSLADDVSKFTLWTDVGRVWCKPPEAMENVYIADLAVHSLLYHVCKTIFQSQEAQHKRSRNNLIRESVHLTDYKLSSDKKWHYIPDVSKASNFA